MSRKVEKNSLIFGMHFGDTKKEFLQKCLNLNQQGILSAGPSDSSVKYNMKYRKTDSVKSNIQMLFYPTFDKRNVITRMDMEFFYEGWSPWNKSLNADQLLPRIKDTLNLWFSGNDFIHIPIKDLRKDIYVKVDANRQIVIYQKDDKDVVVKIENLNQR